jgi:uncharacterized protein YbjQ (UPF0145 family)
MNKVKQEKIFSESNAIEKEMDSLTADDIRHIIVTTTDTIQNRHILDYIDTISAQDVKFQIEHIDPTQTENQCTLSSETFRSSVMLTLEKLRKQAYLVGADAVVGVSIESSLDHQHEREYSVSVITKVNVIGTAVRLADSNVNCR